MDIQQIDAFADHTRCPVRHLTFVIWLLLCRGSSGFSSKFNLCHRSHDVADRRGNIVGRDRSIKVEYFHTQKWFIHAKPSANQSIFRIAHFRSIVKPWLQEIGRNQWICRNSIRNCFALVRSVRRQCVNVPLTASARQNKSESID